MELYPFTLTGPCVRASQKPHTGYFVTFPTIQPYQITWNAPQMRSLASPDLRELAMHLISSCRKFVFCMYNWAHLTDGLFRIPKCWRIRNSDNRISGNRKLGMTSRQFRSLSGVIRVHRPNPRCGETWTLVRILLCLVFLYPELWRLSRADKYVKIWTIKLDLSQVNSSPLSRSDEEQANYYRIDYDVVFLFGRTNLKVQLAWKENVSSILLPLLLAKTHMIVLPVK